MRQTHPGRLAGAQRRQRGFSMIELIVAMVVAVFLLAGLFTVLQQNQDTSAEQTALAQLQDNERFAMSIITAMVETAGYYPYQTAGVINSQGTLLPVDGTTEFATPGQAVVGGSNGGGGDMLISRFVTNPNDGISSCLGHTNTTASTFYYKNILQVDSTQNALTCSDDNGVTAVVLVTNVQSLSVSWGVNTTAGSPNSNCPATTYYTTAQLLSVAPSTTQNLYWTNVCTVQVSLTFINPLAHLAANGAPTPGQPATVTFTKTITLMNRSGPFVDT
jgi:type IV pilus assembly protein PilW